MKDTIIELLEGNSTKTWRRTVCLFILFFILVGSTYGVLGAWLSKEVYSFSKQYVTKKEFGEYSKTIDTRLADYKKSVDDLLMFLLDKHYPDASKVYNNMNKERDDHDSHSRNHSNGDGG